MYKINLHCKLLSIAAVYLQSQVVALMMNISSPFLLHIFTVQSSGTHTDDYKVLSKEERLHVNAIPKGNN